MAPADKPTLACPVCKDTPGKEFDSASDGTGGHYQDCRACSGTARVPDDSTKGEAVASRPRQRSRRRPSAGAV